MGFFKNELIEQQVEVGDRVPKPKPAETHVAWSHVPNVEPHEYREKGDWTVIVGLLAFLAGAGLMAVIL